MKELAANYKELEIRRIEDNRTKRYLLEDFGEYLPMPINDWVLSFKFIISHKYAFKFCLVKCPLCGSKLKDDGTFGFSHLKAVSCTECDYAKLLG